MAATESWWRLGMPEAVLLPWLVGSLPPQAARDYPVYLPPGSPTVSGWVGRAGGTVRAGRSAPGVGPGGPPLGARACHEKRRGSGQPTLLAAAGSTPATDPDASAGLGAVSSLRPAASPQPAGCAGESGLRPAFLLVHLSSREPWPSSEHQAGRVRLYPGPAPRRPRPLKATTLTDPHLLVGPAPLGCASVAPILPGLPLFPPAVPSAFVVSSPAPWPNCLPLVPP